MEQYEQDVRWRQRFVHFGKALSKLAEAVRLLQNEKQTPVPAALADIVNEGLIQCFEYTHELAWNVMKDYAEYQGNSALSGSRDATREAFQLRLISDGHVWMDMINSRNKTSHTYNEEISAEICGKILNEYYPAFVECQAVLQSKLTK